MNVLQILIIIKQLTFIGNVSLNEMDGGRPPHTAMQSVHHRTPGRAIHIDHDADGNPWNYAVNNLHNCMWWPWIWGVVFTEPGLKVTLRTLLNCPFI